ncbi:hypothetical protein ACEQPO_14670 [Bacillus sp. SL00103]
MEQIDVDTFGEFLASNGVPKRGCAICQSHSKRIRDGALAVESHDFETLLE